MTLYIIIIVFTLCMYVYMHASMIFSIEIATAEALNNFQPAIFADNIHTVVIVSLIGNTMIHGSCISESISLGLCP